MANDDLALKITDIAQEVFRQPSLVFDPTLLFREIPGFDSILAIKYILEVEKAFAIALNEEDVDTMHTMGDLIRVLRSKK